MKKKQALFITILIALTFSVNLIAQAEMPKEAAQAYNEGNQLMKSGNFEAAVKQYKSALSSTKDHRVYYQLGVALKKQGKNAEAIEAFKASIADNPQFDVAYNGLGGTYFSEGKYSDAAEAFKKFEQLTKKSQLKEQAKEYVARAIVKMGEASKKDGNYAKAIEQLNEAVKYHPLDAAYVILATTYYENGDYDKAIGASDQVMNLKNSKLKGAANYYKGMSFKQKQDLTKAKQFFEEAKKDPQYKKLAEYELKLMK